MNLIDSTVKSVLSEPYQEYDKWWVKVQAQDDYSDRPTETTIMCQTEEQAKAVTVGHRFLT